MPKILQLIVACAENRVIGRNGKLPWQIPEDLKFFHDATAGQICVLGRVCFETWPRAAKDGRQPIVITRSTREQLLARSPAFRRNPGGPNLPPEGGTTNREPVPDVRVAASLSQALAIAETLPGELHICGGQRIYEEALALARPMRLHLTLIHAEVAGDTFFPEWRHLAWREVARRESADANHRYTFFTLER